jgi:hypothetical protein
MQTRAFLFLDLCITLLFPVLSCRLRIYISTLHCSPCTLYHPVQQTFSVRVILSHLYILYLPLLFTYTPFSPFSLTRSCTSLVLFLNAAIHVTTTFSRSPLSFTYTNCIPNLYPTPFLYIGPSLSSLYSRFLDSSGASSSDAVFLLVFDGSLLALGLSVSLSAFLCFAFLLLNCVDRVLTLCLIFYVVRYLHQAICLFQDTIGLQQ